MSPQETIEVKLKKLGLVLPQPHKIDLPFAFVRIYGQRALVSGHVPLTRDGQLAPPFGKVGAELTREQGYRAARQVALSVLASLKKKLGELDRVSAWLRVFGMVNSAPGFSEQPLVINGFSDLILALYGPERGRHARSAVGMAELPFGVPVEIEAEVAIGGE